MSVTFSIDRTLPLHKKSYLSTLFCNTEVSYFLWMWIQVKNGHFNPYDKIKLDKNQH